MENVKEKIVLTVDNQSIAMDINNPISLAYVQKFVGGVETQKVYIQSIGIANYLDNELKTLEQI